MSDLDGLIERLLRIHQANFLADAYPGVLLEAVEALKRLRAVEALDLSLVAGEIVWQGTGSHVIKWNDLTDAAKRGWGNNWWGMQVQAILARALGRED